MLTRLRVHRDGASNVCRDWNICETPGVYGLCVCVCVVQGFLSQPLSQYAGCKQNPAAFSLFECHAVGSNETFIFIFFKHFYIFKHQSQ